MTQSYCRELAIFRAVRRHGLLPLQDKRIIDMGCGIGARLREYCRFGAIPDNLHGIDISEKRVQIARTFSPNYQISVGDARSTGYADHFFDIVINSTMMSSILDDHVSKAVAAEMLRILKPEGLIIWYDMRVNNPENKDVRGYGKNRVRDHFPGCDVKFQSVTLLPALAEFKLPVPLFRFLFMLPFLRTHYVAAIRRSD